MSHPQQRREDRSTWGKISAFMDGHKPLIQLFWAAVAVLGIQVVLPPERFKKLEDGQANIMAKIQAKDSADKIRDDRVWVIIDKLVTLRCMEVTKRDRELVHLNCGGAQP